MREPGGRSGPWPKLPGQKRFWGKENGARNPLGGGGLENGHQAVNQVENAVF